ncbi:hypothetical protein FJR48_01095 [Sulfurimonas lithotrophica]|uniref:Uncharacterized protein n=1 Tax=Sulfurimonas lithotrophica TaxID=2590022 RepID=A0A5P8NY78_9BACT|nr:hypothetical protein [Sulfurimonas lithotrophica]QFR48395.1 hypothetical protein FJR48_01095 [Sulfurimonas lithotrophica]
MNKNKQECLDILKSKGVNPASQIDFDINGEVESLSVEYIIDTYMSASDESQLVFVTALKKATQAGQMGIDKFFEGMGQLLLMSHLSEKFKV